MSLITEALQLRKNQPRSRVRSAESFPPMRRTSPVGKLFLVLVIMAGLVVLGFWKGTWLLEQVESLAGIRANPPALAPLVAEVEKPAEPTVGVAVLAEKKDAGAGPAKAELAPPEGATPKVAPAESNRVAEGKTKSGGGDLSAEKSMEENSMAKVGALPEPMDVNLTLSMIEDEKARQQLDEENQRKIESFLRRMDIQGVCHQGESSTVLLDTVLVRPGDPVGDLGLKLQTIEGRRLVFADRNGREYSKSY